jgi:hypothetical protein
MSTKPTKKILYSIGGKGGGGKTTAAVSLVDFLINEKVPVLLVDADIENKKKGSLSYFFKDTPKVDIRTPRGLDPFVDRLVSEDIPIVLADMGAGSGKETFRWFNEMHGALHDDGIGFLGIGVVTGDSSTVETVLNWANELKGRTEYLIIRNHRDGDDFGYLESTEPGQRFLKASKAPIIDMEGRSTDIQIALTNGGLSLRQALNASPEVAGPVLSKYSSKIRMRSYVNRIESEFRKILDTLLP